MAVTYLGSRIFYRGSEPTGSTLAGFNNSTYTPYSSGNVTSGMVKINSTNYYVAGCNSSGKTYTYITQLIYYTDTPISSFDFTCRCETDNTGSTYQRRIVVSTDSTIASNHTAFASRAGFALRFKTYTQLTSCTGLTIPAGTFYVYIGPGPNDIGGQYSTIWGYNSAYSPTMTNVKSPTSYTISYAANGGSGTMSPQTKYAGYDITVKSNEFGVPQGSSTTKTITLKKNDGTATNVDTKTVTNTTSKVFSNWKATNGTIYNAGDIYSANESTTMTAQWGNGTTSYGSTSLGTSTRSNETSQITLTAQLSEEISLTYPLTKTVSYSFVHWTEGADGSGAAYDSTSHYSFAEDKTLYAQYSPSLNVPAVSLPSNIAREGSVFKGWSKSPNGALIGGTSYTPSGTETIYAVWEGGDGIQKGMYIYSSTDGQWHRVTNSKVN